MLEKELNTTDVLERLLLVIILGNDDIVIFEWFDNDELLL
jgi:hypothetical protein